jgi:hypothetical protein
MSEGLMRFAKSNHCPRGNGSNGSVVIGWSRNGHSVALMEQRQHMLRVKLFDTEKEKLEAAAAARGWNVSQLIRDFIWQLPEKPA